jgi:transposase
LVRLRPLTTRELEDLESFIGTSNDGKLRDRARMVLWFHKRNMTIHEIADLMDKHPDTVAQWIDRFEKQGFEGLKDFSRSGRPPRADSLYITLLIHFVRLSPHDSGYATHTWTSELLAYHLFQETEVRIGDERVRQILNEHDFVSRRPKAIVRSPDRQKGEKVERIGRLLFGRGNRVVLFEDETELHTNPRIQRCWMPRGKQRTVLTPGKNQKAVVYGALNARTHEVITRVCDKDNSQSFVAFGAQVLRAYPRRRIYLVVDGDSTHTGKRAKEFERENPRLRLVPLPSYSPKLNEIEKLWRVEKPPLMGNAVWKDRAEMKESARRRFHRRALRRGRAFKPRLTEWFKMRKNFVGFT